MNENKICYCPYCKQEITCPFLNEQKEPLDNYSDDYTRFQDFEIFYNQYYLDETRASEKEVTRVLQLLYNTQP